jgi:hypothetical protein
VSRRGDRWIDADDFALLAELSPHMGLSILSEFATGERQRFRGKALAVRRHRGGLQVDARTLPGPMFDDWFQMELPLVPLEEQFREGRP